MAEAKARDENEISGAFPEIKNAKVVTEWGGLCELRGFCWQAFVCWHGLSQRRSKWANSPRT